ncbi:MAG: 5-formyltetrahydrofolate cyclo-ligase [Alkalibacterium sp.]|nr:5-formyltetrahydrofolate cyclo-ligase [Alkalibacterium sp.]TVP92825.1 MAG: 5-formyltetrahydrofolate cyclo-ligase [Alkalibacterium sp.]
MSKDTMRKSMLLSLDKIGRFERQRVEKDMHATLFDSILWQEAECIGLTVSGEGEWDTRAIMEKAWSEGKRVCVPKSIHNERALHFYELTSFDQLEKGYFGIEEPQTDKTVRCEKEAIDLLIVPGLVFLASGYRIGYGGGFFDRFLKDFTKPTVSLLHSNQIVESFPIETHDVPVDFLLTEEGIQKAGLDKETL